MGHQCPRHSYSHPHLPGLLPTVSRPARERGDSQFKIHKTLSRPISAELTINPRMVFVFYCPLSCQKSNFSCSASCHVALECLEVWKAFDAAPVTDGRFYNPQQLNETPLEPPKIAQSPKPLCCSRCRCRCGCRLLLIQRLGHSSAFEPSRAE